MSTVTAVTMQDLGLEHAELLPAGGTLCCSCRHHPGGGGSSFTQVGSGSKAQAGLGNIAVANGSFGNIASAGSGNIDWRRPGPVPLARWALPDGGMMLYGGNRTKCSLKDVH